MKYLYFFLAFFLSIYHSYTVDNLSVAYHWMTLDFEFSETELPKTYIVDNNLPLGLEVYKDRLFVTIPRWKEGVAASLAFINMTEDPPNTDLGGTPRSPKLHAYPNWKAHLPSGDNQPPEIVSPFRVRADACGRLWVLDSGMDNLLGDTKVVIPPTLLIYDLNNDTLLRKYEIPEEQISNTSFFANVAVEDQDCEDSYAYLADISAPALVVYSHKMNESWKVTDKSFNVDPTATNMTIANVPLSWQDGVFGLALSKPDDEGYSTLYYHPLNAFNEYSVSTQVLRDRKAVSSTKFSENIMYLGSRGPRGQSAASFLDRNSGVLFYTLIQFNAVACWKTSVKYSIESQGRVYMNNETMVFPNDIKVDTEDNLWVLSDKLPLFMSSTNELRPDRVNYRILTAKVQDAINGTACNQSLVVSPEMKNKVMSRIKNRTSDAANIGVNTASLVLGIVCAIFFS